MQHENLSKFEQDPYKKVNFAFVVALFNEIGSSDFGIKFNFFVKTICTSKKFNSDCRTVWSWLSFMFYRINRVNSLNPQLLCCGSVDLSSFSKDLEDIEDFLTERAND